MRAVPTNATTDDALDRYLAHAREMLEMDIAFVARLDDDDLHFERVNGDGAGFGVHEGGAMPRSATICNRVVVGAAPSVIPDTRAEPRVNDLETVENGATACYVGVPLTYSDGRTFGTLCCIGKDPSEELAERDTTFVHLLAKLIAEQVEREEVAAANRRLELAAAGVGALLAALAARDGYTSAHSDGVVALAAAVARELGADDAAVQEVEQVAQLHDIGKIGIPDAILRKEGPLGAEEWSVMRRHPAIGADLVSRIEGVAHLAPAIAAEHERWDGSGYPSGLAREQIPLASRIVLVCDAYHAMTSDRPYRRALTSDEAIAELERNSGTQFCPRATRALLAIVGTSASAAA